MKLSFAWQPLRPPVEGECPAWIRSAAAVGAAIMCLGGFGQVLLGWDEGIGLFAPLFASVLLFGLPHGAIDHLVALGLAGRDLRLRALLIVVGSYLLLVALFLVFWQITPVMAAIGFLCMTIYHCGRSDLAFDTVCGRDKKILSDTWLRFTHSALRGLIPIGLPFIAFPVEAGEFLQACGALFKAGFPDVGILSGLFGFTLLLFVVLEGALLLRAGPGKARIAIETCVLIGFFLTVPPLLAIGWYFCLWHGLRHVLRLCRYEDASVRTEIHSGPGRLGTFFQRALPFTLLAIGLLLGMAVLLPTGGGTLGWVALYLVFISSLTFPHVVLVEWMDRRENERGEP